MNGNFPQNTRLHNESSPEFLQAHLGLQLNVDLTSNLDRSGSVLFRHLADVKRVLRSDSGMRASASRSCETFQAPDPKIHQVTAEHADIRCVRTLGVAATEEKHHTHNRNLFIYFGRVQFPKLENVQEEHELVLKISEFLR